jgi:hypothetical protein
MRVLNLKDVKVSRKEEEMLLDTMSNAPKLNEALKDEDLFDLDTVVKALKLEMDSKRRPATISRLLGRVKTLLGREIDKEVFGEARG